MIKQWIERRVTELMGFEDEVVVMYAQSQLEDTLSQPGERLCPKKM